MKIVVVVTTCVKFAIVAMGVRTDAGTIVIAAANVHLLPVANLAANPVTNHAEAAVSESKSASRA